MVKQTLQTSKYALVGLASVVIRSLAIIGQASAAVDTCTWTGAGLDDNFSTASNWTGCDAAGIPEDGDTIEFDVSVPTISDESVVNDMTGLDIAGINLTGAGTSNYSYLITGSDLILTGDITGDAESGQVYAGVNMTLGSNSMYSGTGGFNFGHYSATTPVALNLQTYNFNFDSTSSLSMKASLNGSGSISSTTTAGKMYFYEASAGFAGNVVSDGAGVIVSASDAFGSATTVTINGSGAVGIGGLTASTHSYNLVMNSDSDAAIITAGGAKGGGGESPIVTHTLTGNLTLLQDTTYSSSNNMNVTGTYTSNGNALTVLSGSRGSITTSAGTIESAPETITIADTDKTTDFLSVGNKQTVVLNGERGTVVVFSGGTLKGIGKAGPVSIYAGGILSPGLSPGCISSGDLIVSGIYQVELAGTTECSEYDRTTVTGTVDVTGATLDISFLNDYIPATNDAFIIINNDGSDAVTGEFLGMADGETFDVAGVTMRVHYDAGDGNDVALIAVTVPDAPDTGINEIMQSPMVAFGALVASFAVLGGLKILDARSK